MSAIRRSFCFFLLLIMLLSLAGCKKNLENQFASIKSICEYATLKCYYHNVAEFSEDGKVFIITYGNKKAWIEYSGIIKMGVDASRITVDTDKAGNVTVTMPHAKVLSVNMDIDSINEDWIENGLFATINAEDRTQAIAEAQRNMEESAQNDQGLINQSEERAKSMISQYIKTVGDRLGIKYKITWNIID